MKGFVLGLVVGAAAVAIGDRLVHPKQQTDEVRQATFAGAKEAEERRDAPPEASRPELSSSADDVHGRAREQMDTASAVTSSDTIIGDSAGEPQTDAECACASGWLMRKSMREQAARKVEPKDSDWAYSMEQLLQQFASTHPLGLKFEISSVDCRTTFCEIRAIGRTEDSWEAFHP